MQRTIKHSFKSEEGVSGEGEGTTVITFNNKNKIKIILKWTMKHKKEFNSFFKPF